MSLIRVVCVTMGFLLFTGVWWSHQWHTPLKTTSAPHSESISSVDQQGLTFCSFSFSCNNLTQFSNMCLLVHGFCEFGLYSLASLLVHSQGNREGQLGCILKTQLGKGLFPGSFILVRKFISLCSVSECPRCLLSS